LRTTTIAKLIAPAETAKPSQVSSISDFNAMNWVDYFGLNNGGLGDGDFSLHAVQKKASELVERMMISKVLAKTAWNRSKASKILCISYKSLLSKIQGLGLQPPPELQ
jgi:DNA-binding NtrC family response regulator